MSEQTDGSAVAGKAGIKKLRTKIPERKARAFRAYLELLDTAIWFRSQLDVQLASFNLNLERFRLLELLYREGPTTVAAAAEKRFCARQSLFKLADRLAKYGWVRIEAVRLPAVEADESRLPKDKANQSRLGRRAARIRLTAEGEKFIATVVKRHAKLVYAFMRVIDPREMDRFGRTCRKLREGDPFKLIKEIMMEDAE
jgi:DNA-binding MarR family transcriptional regulator